MYIMAKNLKCYSITGILHDSDWPTGLTLYT